MNDINPTDTDGDLSEALDRLSDRILAFADRVQGLQEGLERSRPPCSSPVEAGSSGTSHAPS